jgi:hypothetical protein
MLFASYEIAAIQISYFNSGFVFSVLSLPNLSLHTSDSVWTANLIFVFYIDPYICSDYSLSPDVLRQRRSRFFSSRQRDQKWICVRPVSCIKVKYSLSAVSETFFSSNVNFQIRKRDGLVHRKGRILGLTSPPNNVC